MMFDILAPDNRLLPRIARYRDALARGVRVDNGEPLPANFNVVAFERNLDNTLPDHFEYQNTQAWAHATGLISAGEAQTIYMALGEVPAADGWASGTDLATKVVVTEIVMELLLKRLRS